MPDPGPIIDEIKRIRADYAAATREPRGPLALGKVVAVYGEIPWLLDQLEARQEENARMREALEEIRRGKTHADNQHPQGPGWSMVYRFSNIAHTAIAASPVPKEQVHHG